MIDVEWNDNAKEAVEMFYRWGFTDNGLLDEFWDFIDNYPTQTKTVADAVGQEAEKWTHTYNGLKCRTLIDKPDREGYIVIINDLNEYYCVDDSELKPIKPTISESEMMQRIAYRALSIDDDDEFGAKVRAWLDEYDII